MNFLMKTKKHHHRTYNHRFPTTRLEALAGLLDYQHHLVQFAEIAIDIWMRFRFKNPTVYRLIFHIFNNMIIAKPMQGQL